MKLARRRAKLHATGALTAGELWHRMTRELRQFEYVLRLVRGPRDPGGRRTVDVPRAALVKRVAMNLNSLGIPLSRSSEGVLGSILRMALVDIEHKQLEADRVRAILRRALLPRPR